MLVNVMEEFRKTYVFVPTQEPTRNTAEIFSRLTFIFSYATHTIHGKYTQLTTSNLILKTAVLCGNTTWSFSILNFDSDAAWKEW